MKEMLMYINNEWKGSANGAFIDVVDPADQSVYGKIPRGSKEDVDQAVEAARTAFESEAWKQVKPHERGYLLNEIARRIREEKETLALMETQDVGKPLSQGMADVEAAARYFEYYGGVADKILGETIPIEDGILDFTVREPVGVTAHIVPWNYPIQIISRSVAAAIATGNTVVVKSAEDTPATAHRLAQFFDEADLLPGVFNLVTGYGKEAGASLSGHPDINHLTFTGSVPTGIAVMKSAAENVVPVTLELGGKSPNIVFEDCDQEKAVQGVVKSIIQNAGQTCSAGSRLLVDRNIKGEFLTKVVSAFQALQVGPGKEDLDIGPILSESQFEKIMAYLKQAEKDGKILAGGGQAYVDEYKGGYYIAPTVIDGLNHTHPLAQEEIFGPVLTVFQFDGEDEAIRLANDTDYGLVTGVWTENISKAHRVADRIRSGQVFINNYGAGGGIQMPFGGFKKSGFGREKGLEALKNYTAVKNVAIKYR
ncbi:aldehyde dehydrogenase [Thalassobacillus devorans]|uniref:Aldehyde dehydrogenase n=1 Tax=Thalassobacillus devorans TaxID=279813 RepID=A0ABQ1NGD4_9BACI|nr:aldehyde dehydrogenase family protein [Thalassobacillus devorans]NIK27282.1 aldehyde dehydrogenase (NAD+) [Thalassobacillus devorans]GGC76438.1 aldehyde dehydrogenase [Thalassobacillus devorans]